VTVPGKWQRLLPVVILGGRSPFVHGPAERSDEAFFTTPFNVFSARRPSSPEGKTHFLAFPAMVKLLAAAMALSAACCAPAAAQNSTGCPDAPADTVKAVEVEGLRTTKRPVVMRELLNGSGRPFDCARWIREKTRLEDLDIFSDVRLRFDTAEGGAKLVYSFRELPPYIPFVAAAKTEQDGLSLGPALTSLNFLGWDIRSEFMARFGGTTEFQASLSSPWIGSWPVEYDLAALRVDSYNHFENFREDSWRLKLDLAQRVWEPEQGGGIAHILYAGELFLLNDGEASDSAFLLSNGHDLVPRLGTGFLWDGRDRRHDPTRGWYQELRVTQNGGWLGGSADYLEWLADTRVYLPWIKRNTLLASGLYQYRTGEIGNGFGRYDRFHVGGVNTLRGYGNDALRGKSEVILTLENRMDWILRRTFKLWGWGGYYALQGVLGLEAASVWDHSELLDGDLQPAVYGGVHLIIAGIDRIRLEFGSKTARFEFWHDIGILEKADIQRFRAR
jgi:outer membrane protein assembly factor BamA